MKGSHLVLIVVASCVGMASCSSESEPKKLTPEQIAENKRLFEEQQAKEEALKLSIFEADEETLKQMLSECRKLITEYADSRNNGPFSNYMIDQYSADVYQYQAGRDALMTDDERIADLKESKEYISFNTEYAILSTSDSFNGPQKSVDKYECAFSKGPTVARAKIAY
ncbi:hypothetical protein [Marinobacter sp. ST-43]|uniref:hypothetical protein n=1 Tax=Marinobacter sp. ST-43 TaxID=3050453 RepID=UPI0026DEE788|nr:hypothetical protein [Marinobacter sp. ST-43]